MATIDRLKAQIENLRENYKTLLALMLMCLGGAGTMVYMAVEKKNGTFYVLFAIVMVIACFVGLLLRKVWHDIEMKTEELENV